MINVADMLHGYIAGIAMMLPTHEFVQIRSEHVLMYPFQGSCNRGGSRICERGGSQMPMLGNTLTNPLIGLVN